MLIATYNKISVEHTTQPTITSFETVTIRTKTTSILTVGAAYAPLAANLDELTNKSSTKYYLIGGDFNAKHQEQY